MYEYMFTHIFLRKYLKRFYTRRMYLNIMYFWVYNILASALDILPIHQQTANYKSFDAYFVIKT